MSKETLQDFPLIPGPLGPGGEPIITGGCAGTRWGCCADGIRPAKSKRDPCKEVDRPILVTCGGDYPRQIRCDSGSYGCFNNSQVGACDPRNTTCVNPIPDSVVIFTNENRSIKGDCYQNGDDLVCNFPNFCNDPGTVIN